MGLLPVLIGGGGLAGIAAVIGTLFLSRSQRDLNLANAAGRLVDASDVFATNLQEDLAAARAELTALSQQVTALNRTVGAFEIRVERAEAERDAALREVERLRAQLGGRREGDTSA
jgi:chromosome segregation ATPase